MLLLVGGIISANAEVKRFKSEVQKLQFANQEFEEIIIDDEKKLAEQAQIILSQKDALDMGLLEIDRLKKVKSQVKVITETQIDSLIIEHHDTVSIESTPEGDFLKLPQSYCIDDDWMMLKSKIDLKGFLIDTLQIHNKYNITIATKSAGFFKKPIPIVQLVNENPYTKTTDMQNVVIKDDKRFYDRKGFWFGTGAILSLILLR
jgi:hypothetical protein